MNLMRNKNRNASPPRKRDAVVAVNKSHEVKQHVSTSEESLSVLVKAKPAIVTYASVAPVAMLTRKN